MDKELLIDIVVGRVGTHVGHRVENLELGIDSDTQEITFEDLTDEESLQSLVGKPVLLNHASGAIGQVKGVYIKDGFPIAIASITSAPAQELLLQIKDMGKVLETSPSFTYKTRIDQFGRVEQYERRYSEISILTPDTPGRGGKSVNAKYSLQDTDMDEKLEALAAKVDALVASMAEMAEYMKPKEMAEDSEEYCCGDMSTEYTKGYEEGKSDAMYSIKVQELATKNGLTLKAEDLSGQVSEVLGHLGLATENASASYSRAAIETALLLGVKKPQSTAEAPQVATEAKKSVSTQVRVKI